MLTFAGIKGGQAVLHVLCIADFFSPDLCCSKYNNFQPAIDLPTRMWSHGAAVERRRVAGQRPEEQNGEGRGFRRGRKKRPWAPTTLRRCPRICDFHATLSRAAERASRPGYATRLLDNTAALAWQRERRAAYSASWRNLLCSIL